MDKDKTESVDLKSLKQIIEDRNIFWKEKYPKLSVEERKAVWLKDVYSGMRRQPEESPDMYEAFSKSWYEFAKETKPEFDKFFEEIIDGLKGYLGKPFDWVKYQERILK